MAAVLALFVMTFAVVLGPAAADPDLLQDVCVADLTSGTPIILLLFFLLKYYHYFLIVSIVNILVLLLIRESSTGQFPYTQEVHFPYPSSLPSLLLLVRHLWLHFFNFNWFKGDRSKFLFFFIFYFCFLLTSVLIIAKEKLDNFNVNCISVYWLPKKKMSII